MKTAQCVHFFLFFFSPSFSTLSVILLQPLGSALITPLVSVCSFLLTCGEVRGLAHDEKERERNGDNDVEMKPD